TTFDLAVIFTLQQLQQLSAGEAATRVRTDRRWQYALHLPLDHPGCTGRDIKTFRKRLEVHQPPRIVQFFLIRAALRELFPES
ncbi:MAG TPA: transposase, partial [Roseiflexaceae bacterium]